MKNIPSKIKKPIAVVLISKMYVDNIKRTNLNGEKSGFQFKNTVFSCQQSKIDISKCYNGFQYQYTVNVNSN